MDKDQVLENINATSEVYFYHISEISRLRKRISELVIEAHDEGASDREISKHASLSRARIQQIRTGK